MMIMKNISKIKLIPSDLDEYWAGWEQQSYRRCPFCLLKLDKEFDLTSKDLDEHLYDHHRRIRDDGDVERIIMQEVKELAYAHPWDCGDTIQEFTEVTHGEWIYSENIYLILDIFYDYNEMEIAYSVYNEASGIEKFLTSDMHCWKKLSVNT